MLSEASKGGTPPPPLAGPGRAPRSRRRSLDFVWHKFLCCVHAACHFRGPHPTQGRSLVGDDDGDGDGDGDDDDDDDDDDDG